MLYEALHAGSADADVQRIASGYILDLIEPYPNPRGRPAQVGPQRWVEIGEYYLAERARGRNHTRALRETWADFTFSREHIRKAVRFFQIARGGVTT